MKRLVAVLCSCASICAASCGVSERENTQDLKAPAGSYRKPASKITFLSTQLNPVEEAGKMRTSILQDFPGTVDFKPNDSGYVLEDIDAEIASGRSGAIIVGALHGDLAGLQKQGRLRDLDELAAVLAKDRSFQPALLGFAKLDGQRSYYVPWMQASFVMAADKKALRYLPEGASLDRLSYGQLMRWAVNVRDAIGKPMLGFPAGTNGLFHRFLQGYLYPSFTGKALLKFKSGEAISMWNFFGDLWKFVNPASLGYSSMSEPLLAGDVWIAWDHTARLAKAFEEEPGRFVAFPAPIGPFGRGFTPVISGLAIPKGEGGMDDQAMLIDYLTTAPIQERTLRDTGFFPVIALAADINVGGPKAALAEAVRAQAEAPESIPALMPIGLGKAGSDYNQLFVLTFSEIVLEGRDVRTVLESNAALLQAILVDGDVSSWPPDPPGERPCRIE